MRNNAQSYSNTSVSYPVFPRSGYGMNSRIPLLAYVYYRLSREEAQKSESTSISNQKKIVEAYCKQHGITILKSFVDDGWSGGNFERPGFQRMISDIEQQRIKTWFSRNDARPRFR